MKLRKKLFSIMFILVFALFVRHADAAINTKSVLIGQWHTLESNVAIDLLAEKTEFFDDGIGILESSNRRGIGVWAESF